MGLCIRHPKRNKSCAFCNYWISDIKLTFVNSSVGFEYDHDAQGRCVKSNGKMRAYCYCPKYEPSIEAKKLL